MFSPPRQRPARGLSARLDKEKKSEYSPLTKGQDESSVVDTSDRTVCCCRPMHCCSRVSSLAFYLVILVGALQGGVLIISRYGASTRDMFCGASFNAENVRTLDNGVDTKEISSKSSLRTASSPSADGTDVDLIIPSNMSIFSRPSPDLPTVFDGIQARAFEPWPADKPLPCYEAEPDWHAAQDKPSNRGFIYLKGYKTGSSTSSGINLRMARNIARRQGQNFTMCKARYDHAWATVLYKNRIRKESIMWTVVRNPTARILSQFFHFKVSREKTEPSDENFIHYLLNGPIDIIQDYYLSALSLKGFDRGVDDPVQVANRIIADYDFIGVTERMDESALALAMLMGLPISDILYLTAKGHGGFDDAGGRTDRTCTYIWPSFVSDGMQAYLDSEQWKSREKWDLAFFQAANRSLDLTIDRLGRDKFEKNLALYEVARELSRGKCLHKTTFPCSPGGKFTDKQHTDCLWNDSGCGSECLDEVADMLDLW